MRKLVTIVLSGVFAVGLMSANLPRPDQAVSAAFNKTGEPQGTEISVNPSVGGTPSGLRENNAVLVDSSQNGYGLVSAETNPISVNPDNHDQIIMAYRQYTDGSASGSIGMAASTDAGLTWTTYSNLNFGLADAGRYPSALAAGDYPMALWNEYGGGGGTYGGRPYYTFDLFGYGGGFWFPGQDIHNSPASHDSWVLVPTQNVDADGNYIVNVVVTDWSGNRDRIHFRAQTDGAWAGAALPMSSATLLVENSLDFRFEGESNYTSNGNMDINSSGVGYYALTSYWNDEIEIANHTLFIKKTTDFGATWSDWYYVPDEVLNGYFESVFPDSIEDGEGGWAVLSDAWTPFLGYDTEVTTDENGGLHVIVPVLPSDDGGVYPYWAPENGIYHFHMAEDVFALASGPVDVEISTVASMQLGWQILGDGGWQANGMSVATDLNVEDKLYLVWYDVSDTVSIGDSFFSYIDVMGTVSFDNGATWSEAQNLTQTFDANMDETYPHLNKFGTDGQVAMMYQMPDYDQPTVTPDEVAADYLSKVYFMMASIGPVDVVDTPETPVSFELANNYPNPFNPTTTIEFSMPTSGLVELKVYDITGREVSTVHQGYLNAGVHQYTFNAGDLASGAYFYGVKSQGFQTFKKMLLVK